MKKRILCIIMAVMCLNITACKDKTVMAIYDDSGNISAKELIKQLDLQGSEIAYVENSVYAKITGQTDISKLVAGNSFTNEENDWEKLVSQFDSDYAMDIQRDEDTFACKYKLKQTKMGMTYNYIGAYYEDYIGGITSKYSKSSRAENYSLSTKKGNTCNTDITMGISSKDVINPTLKQILKDDTAYTVSGTVVLGDTDFYSKFIPMMLEENYITNADLSHVAMRFEVDFDRKTLDILHFSLVTTDTYTTENAKIEGIKFDYYINVASTQPMPVTVAKEVVAEVADVVPLDESRNTSTISEMNNQAVAEQGEHIIESEEPKTVKDALLLLVEDLKPEVSEEEYFDLIKFNTAFASYKVYLYYVHSDDYTVYDEFKMRNTIHKDYVDEAGSLTAVTGTDTIDFGHYSFKNDVLCKAKYITILDSNTILAVEGVSLEDTVTTQQVENIIITIVNALGLKY